MQENSCFRCSIVNGCSIPNACINWMPVLTLKEWSGDDLRDWCIHRTGFCLLIRKLSERMCRLGERFLHSYFCVRSLSIMRITAVGCPRGPAIPTSARIPLWTRAHLKGFLHQ
jgi:hypothetical protein